MHVKLSKGNASQGKAKQKIQNQVKAPEGKARQCKYVKAYKGI